VKKFVFQTIFWATGFCLVFILLAVIQKPSATIPNGTECCRKPAIEPQQGGELLIESLSRQFVSTVSAY
jgi:hypothetical protein